MEPTHIAVAAGTLLGLKDIVPKILGPSADYLGGELRSYTAKGVENLRRIFANAGTKLGDDLNKPGQVSPKVLKNILDEGYFSEDELAAEYFGGVLASSRTTVSRDDRGATFVKLVSRLSSYQLRAHHVFYATIRKRHPQTAANVYQADERKKLKAFISIESFGHALDFQGTEDINTLLPHVMNGLVRESLIEDNFYWGPPEQLKKKWGFDANETGLIISPSALGIELSLWAYGKGDHRLNALFDPSLELNELPGVTYPP